MIPDKVKIGIYDYDVVLMDDPIIANNQVCSGAITYDELKIEIKEDLPKQKQRQTLFHEIVHGIIRERKIPYSETKEEMFVDEMAIGIMEFIKDNPELIKSIVGVE